VIATANGLISIEGLIAGAADLLKPHSADWFSPVCLTYPYEPDAQCPHFLAFLDEVLEHDAERIAMVQEWYGYCLTPDTTMQKFLVVVGEGANGKSAFADTLTALLGNDNVSHVPLELFGERFQLTVTLGKLANVATEIGEIDRAAEGILKAYTSGDCMHFDRKNLPPLDARPSARLVLTTNNLPRFRDRSSGVWRRMIVLPFRVSIPEGQQDRHLSAKLKAELPGILNWSLEGLRRLRQRGRFIEPAVCQQAVADHKAESNPARMFLQEHVQAVPTRCLRCADAYNHYKTWSKENGYEPLNERQFGKDVARVFP
jgi:putative DNA primase/helicase